MSPVAAAGISETNRECVMLETLKLLRSIWRDRRGVTAVEYGVIAALMATALVGLIASLTGGLTTAFSNIVTHLTTGT
jgi:pilus assembly protein Flp/PilA